MIKFFLDPNERLCDKVAFFFEGPVLAFGPLLFAVYLIVKG